MHKALGFNMVRKHIKVEPRTWYTHCDQLGLLVLQDMPSVTAGNADSITQQQFQLELKKMILNLRNYQSIVQWEVFNEAWGEPDLNWAKLMAQFAQNMDPTRLIDDASGWTYLNVGNVIDNHHYPDPG